MASFSRIQSDMQAALKGGNKDTVTALRSVMAQLKDEKIKLGHELSEDEVTAVLNRAVKRRKESIDLFRQGGRLDLVDKEQAEIDLLSTYLPKQLSESEILAIINLTLKETGVDNIKDIGKVMGPLMQKVKGLADGKVIQSLVRERLST
jgi:uncharacterized protein YqeY